MDAKIKLYQDFLARNLDRRKDIIFAALTLVTGFGVTVLVSYFNGKELVTWSPFAWREAVMLSVVFVFTWSIYFAMIYRLERNASDLLAQLSSMLPLAADEQQFLTRMTNKEAKWAPFAISVIVYLGILGPF